MVALAVNRSKLLIRLAPWDSLDDEFARRIPMDDPTENANVLREMVKAGTATAHQLLVDGVRTGILFTRIEIGSLGRELVVIAVYSQNTATITPPLSLAIDAMAKNENCLCIRFHTCRHGLAKLATEKLGYRLSELILRKNVE